VSASRTVWRSLHAALRRATLLLLLERLERQSPELSHDHLTSLEGAIDAGHGPLQPLPHGTSLEETADRFTLRTSVPTRPAPLPDTSLHVPGDTEMGSGWIKAEILERAEELSALLAVRGPLHALCDADAIQGRLVVGARRPGDRMTLLGSPGSRKVQDIMVDRKVPGQERDRVPVIRDEAGIVWIAGVALAARTAIRQDTRRILHLTCQPDSLNT
jgi:tRNA(Ile)-lysidine synthase